MLYVMTAPNNWRANLRRELKAADVRVTVLSEQLGFHRDYISNMLREDGSEPGIDRVRRICDAAGIDFARLFVDEHRDAQEMETLRRLSKLSDSDLDRATLVIDALISAEAKRGD